MNITIQTLFALLATVLYIGELEGQISANQLKKPRAEEGAGRRRKKVSKKPNAEERGWAQEEESVQKAQRRRGGLGIEEEKH